MRLVCINNSPIEFTFLGNTIVLTAGNLKEGEAYTVSESEENPLLPHPVNKIYYIQEFDDRRYIQSRFIPVGDKDETSLDYAVPIESVTTLIEKPC